LHELLASYGYWAVFGVIALESMGLPLPGESALIAAALYAGTTHDLALPLVVAAAAGGAILGDNAGYWIGREAGLRLLLRFGYWIRLDQAKVKLGQYLFLKRGGGIVFFGRFVALLRTFAALLAGASCMPWLRFLLWNALGGACWAMLYGTGGFFLGHAIHRFAGPLGWVALALAAVLVIAGLRFLHRNMDRLQEEAERALPGPVRVRAGRQPPGP
jgi:membrane protein DedA with SNARE-associated domain